MKVSDHVWDMVNRRKPTAGFLATADAEGNCDAACFGSLELSDSETMTMLIGDNHTLSNLKQNPKAVFVVAAGDTMEDADGCRLYLEVKDIVEEGPVIDKGRQIIAAAINPEAADLVKAFVSFEVAGVRPLADMGQEV